MNKKVRLVVASTAYISAKTSAIVSETSCIVPKLRVLLHFGLVLVHRGAIGAKGGKCVRALFAIEILSDSESHQDVLDKITERGPQDYFDGGAQLVWYITPKRQKIYAYTSPDESTVFKEPQTITAAPVIPDFQLVVADLFASA